MTNRFFRKLEQFNQEKKTSYSELGCNSEEPGLMAPYRSFYDFADEFGALFLKFWDNVINFTLNIIFSMKSLSYSVYYLARLELPPAKENALNAMEEFFKSLYFLQSAITDSVINILSLITRSIASCFVSSTNSEENLQLSNSINP